MSEQNIIFVAGATGATGRLLVEQLVDRGQHVRAVVRSPGKLPESLRDHKQVAIIRASLLDLSDEQLADHLAGCRAAASCLGHTLSVRGIFGPPRRLVTDATRRLCRALKSQSANQPRRFVLMNTAGNRNRDLNERVSLAQRFILGALRVGVPPVSDNEQAADYLRTAINQNDARLQWAAVRPDSLIDEDKPTEYDVYPSPTRSAIFNPGRTSRVNVAHFMAELLTDDALWSQWCGQMPVVYNRDAS